MIGVVDEKRGFSQLMMHKINHQVWVWILDDDDDDVEHWDVDVDWFQIERLEPVAVHGEEVWVDSDRLHQLPELLDRTYERKGHRRITFYLKKVQTRIYPSHTNIYLIYRFIPCCGGIFDGIWNDRSSLCVWILRLKDRSCTYMSYNQSANIDCNGAHLETTQPM